MFLLCIIQDLGTAAFEFSQYLEADKAYFLKHTESTALFVSISIFLFFFLNNLIYWLYGFKYWVMSIEVPQTYNKERKCRCSERMYNVIKWVGIILNFALCSYLGYERYHLSLAFASGENIPHLVNIQLDLQLAADALLIIAAFFLADALRRLKKEFSTNAKFVQNRTTMCLHVYVIFGHSVVLVIVQFILVHAVKHPSPTSNLSVAFARIVNDSTEAFG